MVVQVIIALVQEQACHGVEHGLSDTLIALLSNYHDQAWCRPSRLRHSSCSLGSFSSFAQLPSSVSGIVLQLCSTEDLMQLHIATAGQVPAVQERLLQLRYGRRWLQLTRRMRQPCFVPQARESSKDTEYADDELFLSDGPRVRWGSSTSEESERMMNEALEQVWSEESEISEELKQLSEEEREQWWRHHQQSSKHTLLQLLRQQIRDIGDVAALIDDWVNAHVMSWSREMTALGVGLYYQCDPTIISRLRQLQNKVAAAVSVGFKGFLHSYQDLQHPDNIANHAEFAVFDNVQMFFL